MVQFISVSLFLVSIYTNWELLTRISINNYCLYLITNRKTERVYSIFKRFVYQTSNLPDLDSRLILIIAENPNRAYSKIVRSFMWVDNTLFGKIAKEGAARLSCLGRNCHQCLRDESDNLTTSFPLHFQPNRTVSYNVQRIIDINRTVFVKD